MSFESNNWTGLLDSTLTVAFVLIGVALILAIVRFLKGPGILDRIVALDLLAGLGISFSVLLSLRYDQKAFLNIALCLAVIAFIATVALALYLEKAKHHD